MSNFAAQRNLQRQREHQHELVRDLLGGRGSPLTVVLDSLSQSAKPFIYERLKNISGRRNPSTRTIYVSFETIRKPRLASVFIPAYGLTPVALQKAISKIVNNEATTSKQGQHQSDHTLIIIDSLHKLLSDQSVSISAYLFSLLGPKTSLLAVYHIDQPLLLSRAANSTYHPHPLKLIRYLATTVVEMHALQHLVLEKAARDRSIAAPQFGLAEEPEGVIQGLGSNSSTSDRSGSVVVEARITQKSGKAKEVVFVLLPSPSSSTNPSTTSRQGLAATDKRVILSSNFILLDEHPLYRYESISRNNEEDANDKSDEIGQVTSFKLGLTEKERRDRDGVILPYFDAQNEDGAPGEGGRILYDMGEEDDFDEEEDEI